MTSHIPSVMILLLAAASSVAAAEPTVNAKIGPDGITEITITPAEGEPAFPGSSHGECIRPH